MISPTQLSSALAAPTFLSERASLDKAAAQHQADSETGANAPTAATAVPETLAQALATGADTTLQSNQNDFRPSLSPLGDETAAAEATQSAQQGFLAQPATALLAQANITAPNAERLLQ
jgi:hypothetical protein